MVRWHDNEAQLSRQRRASAADGAHGMGGRGGKRRSKWETAVDGSRKETVDRVAWH